MTTTDRAAEQPLPGPPEPWTSTSIPSPRTGPPYHMTEMIEAEPALAERVLARLRDEASGGDGSAVRLAAALREAAIAGEPIVVTGCGTSEHGALGVVEILRDAMRTAGLPGPGPVAAQAFEASLDPQWGGLVVGVSHEGATWATNLAIEAANENGAKTALITVSDRSPGAALADIVLATGELDQSWCHTVGYLSPLLAAVATGAALRGTSDDASDVRALLAAGVADPSAAEATAVALAAADHLIVMASGADRPAGRELTLKIEEAAWVPSAFRDLETFLHGHLPATASNTGLILVLTDRAARGERLDRARKALAAARVLGIRTAAIVDEEASAGLEASLTPAGRLVVPEAPDLPAPVAALMGSATPLQFLTERIARARGTNPDPIRRDD
ncbi:MAG TPA: SIS domain-containing protein, partial [Candidatus Acidoferrum sp.]|nr:SIS domain-containing protein [Candidatus Acidoferrum sp.]